MSVLLWILLCLVLLAGLYLFLIAPGRKRPDASALTGWLYAVSYTHLDVYKRQAAHTAASAVVRAFFRAVSISPVRMS